ncbi:Protein-glutamine gamma-glutamyltransferase [Saliniradius amylolyticus]|uniref:Protein-glutamine gamma-glutamyltransferase n=1 Tax=Saliniradius amylolyticus TaxID=2183582 RepID=A0A2S2E1W6_9ALTE|nr:DUF3488 and transglutaminase-like domain-containing protein [Saliniradius amylolyticus]AWL11512.1 Protein-glutamine gamma-glutamyltransferase [Saliniradius amylolyticus]
MGNTQLNNPAHLGLALILLGTALGLYQPLYFWVQLLVVCAVVIQLSLYLRWQKRAPEKRTVSLLALLSLIVLAYSSLSGGLLQAMINLLMLGSTLKLLNLNRDRDVYQLALSNLFMLATLLVFHQDLMVAIYTALLLIATCFSLMLYACPASDLRRLARLLGILTLQALPIMVLLFIALPQLGPLWKMPAARSSQVGLSDSLSPGDIAHLAQSGQLVFRAEFKGPLPDYSQRYWRALTLEHFDGHRWQVSPARTASVTPTSEDHKPSVSSTALPYEVIAEATQQPWLYSLRVSQSTTMGVWHSKDYQLRRRQPLQSSFRYQALWDNRVPKSFNPDQERRINLQKPDRGNPKLRRWGNELRQKHPSNADYIRALLNHLRQQPFRYTLRPPPMPVDAMDRFWFEHQAGFCAHYASALTYLLRLGDIPARVVTGYLGGEVDDDGYISVHQFDAHAWVEWLSDDGWQRLDPTAIAAPLRLDFGLEQAVAQEQSFLSEAPLSLYKLKSVPLLNQLRLLLSDLDYQWSRWVLGFNRQRQRDLLQQLLGELTLTRLSLFGLSVITGIGLLLAIYQWQGRRQKGKEPSEAHYYHRAVSLLGQSGLNRPEAAGPLAYQDYLDGRLAPGALRTFRLLSRLYCRCQYQNRYRHPRWAKKLYRRFQRELK